MYQVSAIAPLSPLEMIEKEIDEAFDDAISPRGETIIVEHRFAADVHPTPDVLDVSVDGRRVDYSTMRSDDGVYRSVASLPSTSETTKVRNTGWGKIT